MSVFVPVVESLTADLIIDEITPLGSLSVKDPFAALTESYGDEYISASRTEATGSILPICPRFADVARNALCGAILLEFRSSAFTSPVRGDYTVSWTSYTRNTFQATTSGTTAGAGGILYTNPVQRSITATISCPADGVARYALVRFVRQFGSAAATKAIAKPDFAIFATSPVTTPTTTVASWWNGAAPATVAAATAAGTLYQNGAGVTVYGENLPSGCAQTVTVNPLWAGQRLYSMAESHIRTSMKGAKYDGQQ